MLLEIFAMAKSLHDLNDLPGLSEIPSGSFNGLSIFELDLSEFPELMKIGFDCFKNLCSMQVLRLSPNINEILSGSFSNCTSLLSLDLSEYPDYEIVSFDCFTKAWSLRELNLGPHIKEIKSGAFCQCTRLQSLDLSNCTTLENISFDTFKDAYSLREIIFPVNSKIKTIHSGAFRNCTSLERLDLSNCVELDEISFDTFKDAWALRELILGPSIKEIKSGAFSNCTSLVRLRIPASVQKISWDTFSGCTQLEEVIFEGATEVDPDAFQNCPRFVKRVFPRKRLPGFRYGKYSELKESLQFGQYEGGTCGISLEEFQEDSDIVVLPCGHAYLEEAFHEWFSRRKICPTCKAEL